MHSRIIELSKDPILKNERMCESSVPDWFYHSIADYTDADTDRDHDIKCFLDAVARVVDVAEDGKSFTFKPKAKQKYFERQYHAFLDKACELTGISLDAFVGEAKYDIGMAMYKLNEHYQDSLGDDYYDLLANRYLKVVVRYLSEEALRKYSFSTLVWYHLRSELSNYARDQVGKPQEIPIEFYCEIPAPEIAPIDDGLWRVIEDNLTYKQFEAIQFRNQGYTNREIAELCGVGRKAIPTRKNEHLPYLLA